MPNRNNLSHTEKARL